MWSQSSGLTKPHLLLEWNGSQTLSHERTIFCFAGIADMQNKFTPVVAETFEKSKNWAMISIGQHHTIALDANG